MRIGDAGDTIGILILLTPHTPQLTTLIFESTLKSLNC